VNKLRSNTPLWAMSAVFGVIALSAYIALESSLTGSTQHTLAGYSDLVKLAPRPAYVTITLP
jgi:type VI secretion system protein ImpK